MPYIFHRTKGKVEKFQTPYEVTISEVRMGAKLVAFAQDVNSKMLQKVLISALDAKSIQDDPDWKGPRQ